MAKILAVTVLMLGLTCFLHAGSGAPEIDSQTATAGVVLLAGSVLVLRGRRKK